MGNSCNICGGERHRRIWSKEGFDLVKCNDCALVFVKNPPTAEDLKGYYGFESGYHSGLTRSGPEFETHVREAQENIRFLEKFSHAGKLLDIGCSTGLFLQAAQVKSWQVQGLEYSADAARFAVEQYGLAVTHGSLDDYVPTTEPRFDVVTMWDVLEHVPDPRSAVRRVRELLRTNGLLFVKTPNVDGLFPRASLHAARLANYWPHPEPPGHLFQFSKATLSRLVQEEGFHIVAVKQTRIPLSYSFGPWRSWFRSMRWFVYCCVFAPISIAGPWVKAGDAMTFVLKKRD